MVVTGLGAITPVGIGVAESWTNICSSVSGIDTITVFDASGFPCRIAGEVRGFNPEDYVDPKEIKKMDTFIQYALATSVMAVEDANLKVCPTESLRVGVAVGVGLCGLPGVEKYHSIYLEKGHRRISPFFIPYVLANMASGHIAMRHGFKGPNTCTVTACAASTHSIGDAFRIIQHGDADVMIAGGAESVITPMSIGGFSVMKALSTRNDEPKRASRPFDLNRDGFVVGEGAGLLVLEEISRAVRRGAKIYAEVVGYGMSADAYHITMPDPEGDGAARCMRAALDSAGLRPEEVDYINAHGTSTPLNDKIETLALKKVFGEHAYRIPVSSTKSMTGHLLGAAGGVEAIFTILAIRDHVIPPTINYETRDPECDLDYVPNQARAGAVNVALSNSFGFGGTNASIIFRRYAD